MFEETDAIEIYVRSLIVVIFFFNVTATTEIYTLSLHDALPICIGEYNSPFPCKFWYLVFSAEGVMVLDYTLQKNKIGRAHV